MNQNRQAPIGVFDSGVGGLTVAREIMRNLPSERIVYFGDTARVPYGSKSKEIVLKFSKAPKWLCIIDIQLFPNTNNTNPIVNNTTIVPNNTILTNIM